MTEGVYFFPDDENLRILKKMWRRTDRHASQPIPPPEKLPNGAVRITTVKPYISVSLVTSPCGGIHPPYVTNAFIRKYSGKILKEYY
jgi:hypothetical protein